MKNIKKGFTLIELLVVIAIIGILASVVLASLNTARDKAADASIKSNINNVRAQAELFFDSSGQVYENVCGDIDNDGNGGPNDSLNQSIINAVAASDAANGAGITYCHDTDTTWVVAADLKTGTKYYCVDSRGYATTTDVALSGPDFDVCP